MSDALRVRREHGHRTAIDIMLRLGALAIARLAGTVSMDPARETQIDGRVLMTNGVAPERPTPALRALCIDSAGSRNAMPAGGCVKLDRPAARPGVDVELTTKPDGVARLAHVVTVREGDDQANFSIDWQPQDRATTVEITASARGVDLTSVVVVPARPFADRWWFEVASVWHGLIASLIITVPLAPIIAAVLSVGLMAAMVREGTALSPPVSAGFVVLGVAWLAFALLLWTLGVTSPDRASLGTYGELNAQLPELYAWSEWAKRQLGPPSTATSVEAWRVARAEVERQLEEIEHERDKRGARWVLGSGYITLWQRLHRAQEALIDLQPLDAVIKHAQRDVLRIHNSTIANNDTYILLLQKSIEVIAAGRHRTLASLEQVLQQVNDMSRALGTTTMAGTDSPTALDARSHTLAVTLDALPVWDPKKLATDLDGAKGTFASSAPALDDLRKDLQQASTFLSTLAGNADGSADSGLKVVTLSPPRTVAEAVSLVRTIRRALNEFRDGSRAGLVRARNQLLLTVGVTSIVVYTLLWLSLIVPAKPAEIEAGLGYYLVGSVVGLFTRLRNEANAETGIDDFGLSLARLVAAPLLAGLAGLLGVVLISMTTATQNNQQASALVDAFNVTKTPLNVVTAAIFGLSPALLIDRLTQKSEQYKQDLKSSEPSTGTRPA